MPDDDEHGAYRPTSETRCCLSRGSSPTIRRVVARRAVCWLRPWCSPASQSGVGRAGRLIQVIW